MVHRPFRLGRGTEDETPVVACGLPAVRFVVDVYSLERPVPEVVDTGKGMAGAATGGAGACICEMQAHGSLACGERAEPGSKGSGVWWLWF